MRIYSELDLNTFHAWSGAIDTLERIRFEGKTDLLEQILNEAYPEGMSEEDLNDLLWFESDQVYEWLEMKTDEEIEEERQEREDKIKAFRAMMEADDPEVFCDLWEEQCGVSCLICPLYESKHCMEDGVLDEYREKIIKVCKEYIAELEEDE